MSEDDVLDISTDTKAGKMKSAIGERKVRADQRFSKANLQLGKSASNNSGEDDLRTMLNRIRKGLSMEREAVKNADDQPA